MLAIKSFVFSPVQENTYVLSGQKDACWIIDPGCYFGNERNTLREYIEEQGLKPERLLNTHCHLDHVFGNKFVHDTWDLPLHLHEKEKPLLAAAPEYGQVWGLPFENYRGELIFIREGEVLTWGAGGDPAGALTGEALKVLFLPGHSPGSVGFYCEAQGFIIGGDVLFRESIGRTDLPGGDHETLLRSIREQLWPLPDDTIVYPGHGEPTTIGWEKLHNPFLRR
ncbi:MAG: MBL fold metallo-hydrolase [Bacteroidota bacterium]|nr:MBL fold metallo-hydrolase [Bacteroidota bacterium]MDP4216456.1 MBL fold metallo-hydrolase [Bacteroidota bacterium]MDP4246051.1 MBL fold metallo-hydrolase [Bacteroidota bacterium]MDP4252962.1 MBL fold metallo-hydrolase [Bacteroidota bacterium]MDP4259050.1 MBL fold metallo-hydrolase [Bacteroidota bacterium]